MTESQALVKKFLASLTNIELEEEKICIVFDEVFQHDEALISYEEISDMEDLTPDSLHEELRTRADCFFYGATIDNYIKLAVTGSYDSIKLPITVLIEEGIVKLEPYDLIPAVSEEPYVRIEETLAGSEEWQFPISSASEFDLSMLNITVYEYKVFDQNQQVLGEISYKDDEVETEISDSGLNPIEVGMQVYGRQGSGELSCIGEVFGDSFQENATELVAKLKSS